ncbi:MAG: cyclopropane fatty acyl phospholipid synthase [Neisseriaceae bacterium]|nr:cyclopropane fatty acyl phospholipid synthase [Neisseriaceae bacterium]
MSSSCLEHTQPAQNRWYSMAQTLLQQAGITINGRQPYDLQVHHPDLFERIFKEGSLGLGESYMDGWWRCERLDQFFERVLRSGLEAKLHLPWQDGLRLMTARIFNRQSRRRAWQVGQQHYDLGNDLFTQILDPHMQYSCGYWPEAATLAEAQAHKLRLICEKLRLAPGQTLLDIGCGWGGLAAYAARHYGVRVVGLTISAEQQRLAQAHCAGLDVDIRLEDYRSPKQRFDRVVSVGMFEHVGPKNHRTYFNSVRQNLKDDGLFLLHTIGSNRTSHRVDPWVEKYIFPNGNLPSITQISQTSEALLVMEDWHNFGADYDRTLMAWLQRFSAAWPSLAEHYGERFERMFSYYLQACAGAFRARDLQLWQVLFSPHGVNGGLRVARS